jgi:hypothetical protein
VALYDLSGFGYSEGWSSYPMNKFGIDSKKPDLPRFGALLTQYCQQMGRHLEEKGWHDVCFILPYDEPPPPLAGEVLRILQAIRAGDPKLQITIICDLHPELATFATTCHFHMAPGSVHLDWAKDWKSQGKRIGYSCWEQPLSRYRYVMNRIAPWLTYWDYGDMTGYYCGALIMPGNPWTEMEKCLTILYPPLPGGPHLVRSVRYEIVREAIEDFDYFKVLESKNREVKKRLNYPDYDEVERVREILAEIVTGETATDFIPDRNLLYHLRDKIAEEIEGVDQTPLVLVRTEPADNSATEFSSVQFAGAVERGSQVRIGGQRVMPDCRGRFTATVELAKRGDNIVPVEVSKGGRRKVILRRFVLKADSDLSKLAAILEVGGKIGATVTPGSVPQPGIMQGAGSSCQEDSLECSKRIRRS